MILLYIRAALGLLLGGTTFAWYWGPGINILACIAMVVGAFGIANEKRWGYRLAVGVTLLGLLPLVAILVSDPGVIGNVNFFLLALFPAAQAALLLHPMSRQHQRIWFT